MATVTKWSATVLNSFRRKYFFSVKLYMSTTLNDKMTDICYPLMENKKKMCNSRNVCYYGNKTITLS